MRISFIRHAHENETLSEVLAGIILWSGACLVASMLLCRDRPRAVVGLIAGTALSVFYILNLYSSIEGALDFDEKGAVAYTRKKYLIRYLVICICFTLVAATGAGNIYTCFAGIMGIKIGAYIQPLVRKYIFRRRESEKSSAVCAPDNGENADDRADMGAE
ncbi:MAG TPA: hypothetical protein DCL38_00755 [Lachnospiraceae bacterium]|nr:hypothetical protein [Lachnospiraceae bacterium]